MSSIQKNILFNFHNKLRFIIITLISFLLSDSSYLLGQSINPTISDFKESLAVKSSSEEFDQWILDISNLSIPKKLDRLEQYEKKTVCSGRVLKDRLLLGYYINDTAFHILTNLHNNYDSQYARDKGINSDSTFIYSKSFEFIDSIIPLLYKRPKVKLMLLSQKAKLLTQIIPRPEPNDSLDQLALDTYLSYQETIKKEAAEWELFYKKDNKKWGDWLLEIGEEIKIVSKRYDKGINSHFFKYETDKHYYEALKDNYVTVIKAKINLYLGDAKKLGEIGMDTKVYDEVLPYLKKELEAAGGDWEKYLEDWMFIDSENELGPKRKLKGDKQKGRKK